MSSPHPNRLSGPAALGAVAGVVAVVGALLLLNRPAPTAVPEMAVARSQPSGSTIAEAVPAGVQVLTGGIHTVYHSSAPLPTADAPRQDGRPTLVWFSGTWCDICHRMEPYANTTFKQFEGRLAFVEKSVDHDRAAANRYGVRGTPTFVLLDAQGRDVARFFYQPDADRLAQAVDRALAGRS